MILKLFLLKHNNSIGKSKSYKIDGLVQIIYPIYVPKRTDKKLVNKIILLRKKDAGIPEISTLSKIPKTTVFNYARNIKDKFGMSGLRKAEIILKN